MGASWSNGYGIGCGAGGREFKPRHFQNIFDLMERFDETVWRRRRETVWRNGLTSGLTGVPRTRASRFKSRFALRASWRQRWVAMATFGPRSTGMHLRKRQRELVRVRNSIKWSTTIIFIALFGLGNGVTAVFSLLFFFLTVYDVTKKAWYGRNMVNWTDRAKRTWDTIVETTL